MSAASTRHADGDANPQVPHTAEVLFRLADLALDRGDDAAAEALAQRALDLVYARARGEDARE